MFQYELSNEVAIARVDNGHTAGTSLITSSTVDTNGYAGVCFVASLATVVDGSLITLSALENATNSNSGGTAVTNGATSQLTASTSSNTDLVLDVQRPAKRYLYCTLARTTQNATVNAIYALLYKANQLPVTQPATVVELQVSSPEV